MNKCGCICRLAANEILQILFLFIGIDLEMLRVIRQKYAKGGEADEFMMRCTTAEYQNVFQIAIGPMIYNVGIEAHARCLLPMYLPIR